MNALFAALSKAQAQMRAADLDKVNPHFRSKYASLNSVWDAIRKPLTDNGLAITQTFTAGERLTMLTKLTHSSGDSIESAYPIDPVRNDPQGIGSAITYARRYAISALVGLTADEDDDGNAASPTPAAKKPESKAAAPTPAPQPAAVVAPAPKAEAPAPAPAATDERKDLLAQIKKAVTNGRWKPAQLTAYCKSAFGVEKSDQLSIAELKMLVSVVGAATPGAAMEEQNALKSAKTMADQDGDL